MDKPSCSDAFSCLPRLFSNGSFINLDFLSDENLGLTVKEASGESDEVMLSDLQTEEESSPGETAEYEYGERDEGAAGEYVKKTTTETEQEDYGSDEGHTTATTVPQPQTMGEFQGNVVPVPMETLSPPVPPEDDDEDSKRNSEEGTPELSVAHSSMQADRNSEFDDLDDPALVGTEQGGASGAGLPSPQETEARSPDADEGSVKVIEGEDGRMSGVDSGSVTFDNSEDAVSSPVMFPSGMDPGSRPESGEPAEKAAPLTAERGVDLPDLPNIGNVPNTEPEVTMMKQTMEAMMEDPEEQTPPGKERKLPVTEQEAPVPIQPAEKPTEPVSSAPSRETGSAKKGGLPTLPPALPPRKGMGSVSLSQKAGSGTTSSRPRAVPQTQQEQPQQNRSGAPVGIGTAALPPRAAQPQPAQQQAGHNPPVDERPRPTVHVVRSENQPLPAPRGAEGPSAPEPPEVVEARRKLLDIRLTVLRIASRLGMRPLDFAITDFMSKVDRTEQLRYRGPGMVRPQLDALFNQAAQLDERTGPDSNLDITVTAIVLGPAGSGKTSAILNLLHPGQSLAPDFATESTDKISVHEGRVCGVTFKLIDTPGLSVAASALQKNMKILKGVRGVVQKYKPDAVIYVDRMDLFRRELSDIPLLRLVNDMLPELLYNSIALLTRGSAPPPDAGHATDMPYTEYQRLRLDLCTQIITHALSDMRWAGRPLGFENHPNCSVNSDGAPVLPNGQTFKRHAIFQLVSSYMSGQIEKVCKTRQLRQRTMEQMMVMMQPRKQLQLSALVSQLLAPKPPKKFPDEERELLTKREINRLSSEAEKIEEQNKRRDYTRLRKVEILQEQAHPSQVPIVGASMDLSPSFDHEVNQHRYNATDFVYGWSVRPIMSAQDNIYEHDDGVEMFQVARDGVLRQRGKCVDGIPASMIIQAGKGKNFGNVQMDTGVSHYATRNLVTTVGAVVHPAGQDGEVVYTPTVDIRAKVAERNKVTVGGMACRLAESGWPHKGQLGLGGKIENKYKIKDGVKATVCGGAMTVKPTSSQPRDMAYGGNVELKLAGGKGEYDPTFLFSGGVSHQRRGNFKRTGFSGQVSGEQAISPETMVNGRLQLSAGGSGTASLRMITHDKPQSGLLMAVPLLIKCVKKIIGQGDEYV